MKKALFCFNENRKTLPDLPDVLHVLDCNYNEITLLPDKLPDTLEELICHYNHLTKLPDDLPNTLRKIWCCFNRITQLPAKLPDNLLELDCAYNNLTCLPDDLPVGLKILECYDNQLTFLPDNLPAGLEELICNNNKLSILPDLPNTLMYVGLENNPLEANYPLIFTFNPWEASDIIEYVNTCNAMRRARERIQAINRDNVLLELYMKRMMHPSRLTPLLENTELDIDTFMEAYVDSL